MKRSDILHYIWKYRMVTHDKLQTPSGRNIEIVNIGEEDGNIFRGGITYRRGLGKIFYFHTGHESVESLKDENVQRIIKNAIYWCAPDEKSDFYNGETFHQLDPIVK